MLLIRADATPVIGTGHVIRCMALAQHAREWDIHTCVVAHITVPWVTERLEKEGIPLVMLGGTPPPQEDPATLLQELEHVAQDQSPRQCWVVLDGYHFGPDCHKAVREAGYKLLVIDDYAHLPEYYCDILLNQNLGAQHLTYKGSITHALLGLRYTLLRSEFVAVREKMRMRPLPPEPHKLLLNLGGGDASATLREMARHFYQPELTGRVLRVIAGSMPEEIIRTCLKDCPARLEVLHNVQDIPTLLLDTDLCITAGGSTCWELCCLGVPFLVLALAKNQQKIAEDLTNVGAALPYAQDMLLQCIRSFESYGEIRNTALHMVDGKGAQRVLKTLMHIHATTLRPVTAEDSSLILRIANDPGTRNASLQQRPITTSEHEEWFAKQIKRKLPFYVALYQNIPCGYVRFDSDSDMANISLALQQNFRGQGIGKHLLRMACHKVLHEHKVHRITALIKKNNHPSLQTFKAAGFLEDPRAPYSQEVVHLFYVSKPHDCTPKEVSHDNRI